MKHLRIFGIFLILSCSQSGEISRLPVLSYRIDDDGNRTEYSIQFQGFYKTDGSEFKIEEVENTVYIANFFFTSCPSICPPMRLSMIDLAKEFPGQELKLISHTIDPANDSLEVLQGYSEGTAVSTDKWIFLRSTTENTRTHAHRFMTEFNPFLDGTDFYHSSYLSLVDKKGRIRGFYNSLLEEEMERLKGDIRYLLKED